MYSPRHSRSLPRVEVVVCGVVPPFLRSSSMASIPADARPCANRGDCQSQAGRPREQSLASGSVDHEGNRAVAQIDNDDLLCGNQEAELTQFRHSVQHDLWKIVELHVIGDFRAER